MTEHQLRHTCNLKCAKSVFLKLSVFLVELSFNPLSIYSTFLMVEILEQIAVRDPISPFART